MSESSNKASRKDLGAMLVAEKLITPEQLDSAVELQRRQGGKISDILVSQGSIKPEDLAPLLSVHLNVPLIDLRRHNVQPDVLRLVPEDLAKKYRLIPLDIVGDSLMVVMADPEDIRAIEDIKAHSKMKVEVSLGIAADIEQAITSNYRSISQIERQISQLGASPGEKAATPRITAKTPIVQTVDLLIAQAALDRASDIHIEPQEDRLRIRYRIDGILHDVFSFPLATHTQLASRIKVLAGMDISEQRRPQDGQFSVKLGTRSIDIRAATMETPYGERITLRILDKTIALFTLPELGFLPDTLQKYQKMIKSPLGMILVGGPTGSGKTTTLYASINELDRNERNIMTIEDPIEYNFLDISQTQVNQKAGITFAGGLRAIMRHDPDIILIGEIRDSDTATTSVQAALTGHLVLSSVHANDAVGVLFRLLDLDVELPLISSTLIGIVVQRMVRRICTHCRTTYKPSAEELAAYGEEIAQPPENFYTGAGCNLCANTGFRGRTGLFELMIMSEKIRGMLRLDASASEIRQQAIAEGMSTMKHDGMLKVKEGITTIGEVMRSVFSIG